MRHRFPGDQSTEQITPSPPEPGLCGLSGPRTEHWVFLMPPLEWCWSADRPLTELSSSVSAGLGAMKVNLGKEFSAHLETSSEGWSQSGCV